MPGSYQLALCYGILRPCAHAASTTTYCRTIASKGHGNTTRKLEEQHEAARKWFLQLDENTIPSSIAEEQFVRSSGPGGQKTNKSSTKVNAKWHMEDLKKYVPEVLHPALLDSRFFASGANAICISSDSQREQARNRTECRSKLLQELKLIYKTVVPGITSNVQKAKVKKLQDMANLNRLREKKAHSMKKQSRGGSSKNNG